MTTAFLDYLHELPEPRTLADELASLLAFRSRRDGSSVPTEPRARVDAGRIAS